MYKSSKQSQKEEFPDQAGRRRGNITREFLDVLRLTDTSLLRPTLLIPLPMGRIVILGSSALSPGLRPAF